MPSAKMKKWAHVDGPSRLARWRHRNDFLQRQAADRLGIDLTVYNSLECGRERPGLALAVRLDLLTDGFVAPKHWTTDEEQKVRAA